MSSFPPSTSVIVGPGVKASDVLPGYPENPKSPVLASDLANRKLEEVDFSEGLKIGDFAALDFFGDGSLYLLDSPGHCPGHICALARTTPSSGRGGTSFMLLGGDISHFAGHFRPSATLPLPDTIPASAVSHRTDRTFSPVCPCSLFTDHHPVASSDQSAASKTPWYGMSAQWPTAYHDYETARTSVLKMQELDAEENVLVCLAHDATLLDVLPVFNKDPGKDCNNWRESGWKQKCHWGWLNEVPADGRPAHRPIVEGFWRDGKQWDYDLYKKQKFGSLDPEQVGHL